MKATKSDVIWNYLGTIMALTSNFFLLPFLIYYLNGEELGLWYVFLSIGGIVRLFDFGFNPTLARNIAYAWSGSKVLTKTDAIYSGTNEPNISLFKNVIITTKRIYLVISSLALLLLITFGTIYIVYIAKEIDGYRYLISWGIFCAAVFLNLYFGYFSAFLRGIGAISKTNIAIIISRLFQIVSSITLLYLGLGIVAVAVAYLGYGLIFRVIAKHLFFKYKNIGERLKKDKTKIAKSDIKNVFNIIWFNAWRDGIVSVAKYMSDQASVFVISIFLSLTETGIYSISQQLVTAIATISAVSYTTLQPSLQAAYVTNNTEKSKKMLSLAMTVYITSFFVGIIMLIFIGLPILEIIKPETIFNIPVLLAIGLYMFLLKHHSIYASFISNTNKVPYTNSFLISSIAGVLLSVLLMGVFGMGIWGVIIAPIFTQLVYNNWKWPNVVLKSFNINYIDVFRIGFREISLLIRGGKSSFIVKLK